ncbi:MAG: cellulose synthase complex periplasmic endoglucanase BcsZ [Methylobacter sp.]|jgi:endoglucanase|nr:cellulose synthase complex periplasmic endoglucanase BcsZ [Methylobacter sp.]
MKILSIVVLTVISICAQAGEPWKDWEQFKAVYISPEGRVVDGSSPQMVTTSEGQSYALLFALIANDKETFELLLHWTEANLAANDLTANLPAWQWGLNTETRQYGVLDNNSASDSDLWIAYALVEAGRLWGDYRYQSLGYFMAMRILSEEAVQVPHYGWMIVPGLKGFQITEHSWRLNPSYLPVQILKRFAGIYPSMPWQEIAQNSVKFLKQSAPQGFSPEWAVLDDNGHVSPDANDGKVGGYNAIRVYLWLGMLSHDDQDKPGLMAHFEPMLRVVETDGYVAEQYDTKTKMQTGYKPLGFLAAVLPFLASVDNPSRLTELVKTLGTDRAPSNKPDHYYDSVLILLGKGWLDQKYSFNKDGMLEVAR